MKDIIKEIKKQIKLSKGENFDILVSLNYIMGLIQGQEVKDMREIIKSILEIGGNFESIDDKTIDKILFNLNMKVNQKVILL